MEEKIFEIISIIMETNIELININSSSQNIDNWDSLHHMQLILAIEEEFNLEFSDQEIISMVDAQKIISVLQAKTHNE